MKTVYCVASKEETKSQDAEAITRKHYGQFSKNIYIRNYVCTHSFNSFSNQVT